MGVGWGHWLKDGRGNGTASTLPWKHCILEPYLNQDIAGCGAKTLNRWWTKSWSGWAETDQRNSEIHRKNYWADLS